MKNIIILGLVLVSSLFLGCCTLGISNDEIIKESEKCTKANMYPRLIENALFPVIDRVICVPIK